MITDTLTVSYYTFLTKNTNSCLKYAFNLAGLNINVYTLECRV